MAKEKISISLDKEIIASLTVLGKLGWSRSAFINFWLRNYLDDMVVHMSTGVEEVVYRGGLHKNEFDSDRAQ